jgi:hypothetical protein
MTTRILFFLFFITFVAARGGIGGRIAVFRPTTHEYQLQKFIKSDWNCDPFTN